MSLCSWCQHHKNSHQHENKVLKNCFECSCEDFVTASLSVKDEDFAEILLKALDIQSKKGPAYELNSGDKLYNFKRSAELCGGTPLQHLGNHFWKHIAAIFSYIKTDGKLASEPIEERIADAINYLCLIYKMVKENNIAK